ncbi:MAG: hypothetical protein LBE76_09135 [Nitrososphaerota archaeon]|nr:hypothetical protein [Nitrososphaerota archaeon]
MSKKKVVKAFAPGAISSFFEIFDTNPDGTPIVDLSCIGARGGGFGLELGVHTTVTLEEAFKSGVKIFINGQFAPEALVSQAVAWMFLGKVSKQFSVVVDHRIDVPVGMGFGTSAGGALTTGLALREALGLSLTYNQVGQIAHLAELEFHTGLGTVSSLSDSGGLVLVTEPGAPGVCKLDRIPFSSNYVVVAGFYGSKISKDDVFYSSVGRKLEVNRFGRAALVGILEEPSVVNFLSCCWLFAQRAGFASERVCELVRLAVEAGAVGAAQNMIGEAVHAVVLKENASFVVDAFKRVLPMEQVLCCGVDLQGARLVDNVDEKAF